MTFKEAQEYLNKFRANKFAMQLQPKGFRESLDAVCEIDLDNMVDFNGNRFKLSQVFSNGQVIIEDVEVEE